MILVACILSNNTAEGGKQWESQDKRSYGIKKKGHKTYNDVRIFTDEQLHNYTEEELKNYKPKHDSKMLDELEKGPWPSFVSDIKREALHRHKMGQEDLMIPAEICDDLLGVVELSYKEGETHWKHGGIVGVLGYGGGIVGRYFISRLSSLILRISILSVLISPVRSFITPIG